MKRIAIVGGGIAGLSAAFVLEKCRRVEGEAFEYVVFESHAQFGGVIRTDQLDGYQLEGGPDSFLTEKPWASDLCRELGLGDRLIGSNDSERKTYILVNGKLVEIPDGLMFMIPTEILPTLFSPLFSISTKIRMTREWFHPPRHADRDENVAAFVERHYGPEMVDRLADPLLCGVYGGHANQLSVRAVLPRFAEMEAKYGSLGRAMVRARREMGSKTRSYPLFTSLLNGMQQMVDSLVARLSPGSLAPGITIQSVDRAKGGWQISARGWCARFDAIILAVPSHVAGALLQSVNAQLAHELRAIRHTSSVAIHLGYGPPVRDGIPPGFGFLVPRSQGRRIVACTFMHTKFPHRAPADRALLRCFTTRPADRAAEEISDEQMVKMVRHELREILGLTREPLFSRVYRWDRAMPQYEVGHLERLGRIEELGSRTSGLFLAGNAYRGIGVPDCVRSGSEAATSALNFLGITGTQASACEPVGRPHAPRLY